MKKLLSIFFLLATVNTCLGQDYQDLEYQDVNSYTTSFIQERKYVSGFAGLNLLNTLHTEGAKTYFYPGFIGGIAVGQKITCHMRVELEYAYRTNTAKSISFDSSSSYEFSDSSSSFSSDSESFSNTSRRPATSQNVRLSSSHAPKITIKTQSILANFYYDFDLNTNWTTYIGAGIGWVENRVGLKHHDLRFEGKDSGFGLFQWIAGINRKINYCTDCAIEYRFFHSKKFSSDNSVLFVLRRYFD